MEETDNEDQGLEGLMRAFVQRFFGKFGKGRAHVEFKTIWGLGDHLQGFLEDAQRKSISWLGGQPQPEVFVGS